MAGLLNEDRAQKTLRANLPPRYFRLDRLERYVDGTQYEGRPHWWDETAPIYERAPCFVYSITESAITSIVDMCLGEGRWPAITARSVEEPEDADPESKTSPDAQPPGNSAEKPEPPKLPRPRPKKRAAPFDDRFALSGEEAEIVDALIEALAEQARLRAVSDETLSSALGCGTSVPISCVRDGRMTVETTLAKWCKPTFDPRRSAVVTSLEIRYPYLEEYFDEREHKWAVRCMLYRRVIDAQSDVTFLPAKASETGGEPDAWIRDESKSVDHELGFCPVDWYAFRKRCGTVAEMDGKAVHARQLDEIDALNFALSQRHSAAMVASSPPTIETGVDEGFNPAPVGRQPRIIVPTEFGDGGRVTGGYMTPGSPASAARKRGPGQIWQYPSAESRVEMLTMAGDALKPVDDAARDERSKIAEALNVVFIDPDNAKFSAELSGKALARLYDREVRFCDKVRENFGDEGLLRMVNTLLRVALATERRAPGSVYLPGLKEAMPILERYEQDLANGERAWFALPLDLTWGAYFAPDAADETAIVQTTIAAHGGGYITKYSAVEKIREVFAVGNVDEYLDDLEAEDAAKADVSMVRKVTEAEQMAAVQPQAAVQGLPIAKGPPS